MLRETIEKFCEKVEIMKKEFEDIETELAQNLLKDDFEKVSHVEMEYLRERLRFLKGKIEDLLELSFLNEIKSKSKEIQI